MKSAFFGIVFGLAGLSLGGSPAAAAPQRPNVLFICTDQQRIEDMSCAGNPWVKTPAMDGLAARGVRFTRSFCAFPLCSPSRASHVTSRMPYEIGITTNSLKMPDGLPSLGTLFKAAGYRTVWTGKWHLPSSYPDTQGEIPGFEILFGHENAPAAAAGQGKKQRSRKKAEDVEEAGGGGTQHDPTTVEAAIRFLKEKQTEPFLLVVSLLNPHDVCSFTEKTPRQLNLPTDLSQLPPAPANVEAPDLGVPSAAPRQKANTTAAKRQNTNVPWDTLTWRQQFYYYYRLTERVDRLIGEVLNTLRETGLEQDTLVLFTSDHGEMGGAHRRIRKMSLYEEAMAVPFILAGPGVPRGMIDQTHLISGLDVLPTLCDFAGIAPPPTIRGLSVRKITDDPGSSWRDIVFGAVGETGGRMARSARYKYNLYAGNKDELFDLQADPGETRNLAASGQPAHQAEMKKLRAALEQWRVDTNDRARSTARK